MEFLPVTNPKLTLVSHALCPFVQRAAIVLAEKKVAFERIDIDLADKPDWFLAISPLGKVPLLKVVEDDGHARNGAQVCRCGAAAHEARWGRLSAGSLAGFSAAGASTGYALPDRHS